MPRWRPNACWHCAAAKQPVLQACLVQQIVVSAEQKVCLWVQALKECWGPTHQQSCAAAAAPPAAAAGAAASDCRRRCCCCYCCRYGNLQLHLLHPPPTPAPPAPPAAGVSGQPAGALVTTVELQLSWGSWAVSGSCQKQSLACCCAGCCLRSQKTGHPRLLTRPGDSGLSLQAATPMWSCRHLDWQQPRQHQQHARCC